MTSCEEFHRPPGLYRLWDIQFVLNDQEEYRIHFDSLSEDRTPLFAIYRRRLDTSVMLQ